MTLAPSVGRCACVGSMILSIFVLGLVPGCMSRQLQFTMRRTVNALPDLQYQQVIDNLARIGANPGFLPYFAVAGQGSVQVTDNGSSSLALNMAPQVLGAGAVTLGAARNVTGTWNLGTITSPEKIRSMQVLYRRAIRGKIAGDPAFGWLNIGCKGDVPRRAAYVGRFDHLCVWVMPEEIAGLSDFTLAILDIATREDAVHHSSEDGRPLSRGVAGDAATPRRNFQVPPVGPVFTPGVH